MKLFVQVFASVLAQFVLVSAGDCTGGRAWCAQDEHDETSFIQVQNVVAAGGKRSSKESIHKTAKREAHEKPTSRESFAHIVEDREQKIQAAQREYWKRMEHEKATAAQEMPEDFIATLKEGKNPFDAVFSHGTSFQNDVESAYKNIANERQAFRTEVQGIREESRQNIEDAVDLIEVNNPNEGSGKPNREIIMDAQKEVLKARQDFYEKVNDEKIAASEEMQDAETKAWVSADGKGIDAPLKVMQEAREKIGKEKEELDKQVTDIETHTQKEILANGKSVFDKLGELGAAGGAMGSMVGALDALPSGAGVMDVEKYNDEGLGSLMHSIEGHKTNLDADVKNAQDAIWESAKKGALDMISPEEGASNKDKKAAETK